MIDFENLTQEQLERAKACETVEDIMAFAAEEGYELTDDELEAISGGMQIVTIKSPAIPSPIIRIPFKILKPDQE